MPPASSKVNVAESEKNENKPKTKN